MKSSASELRPFQSRSIVEIPCRARREERLSLKNGQMRRLYLNAENEANQS